jgi:hypothetical protein
MSLFTAVSSIRVPQPYNTCGDSLGSIACYDNYCQYFFINWSLDYQACIFSDRTVNVNSSCAAYPVTPLSGNGSYNYNKWNNTLENNSNLQQVWVPSVELGETTYFPGLADCGPRCQQILAFEPFSWLYICNNTVSEVVNATSPEQFLSDTMAKMSASALFLGGSQNSTTNHNATPYHRYPVQLLFGQPFNGDQESISSAINQFTTGAIAIMDMYNPLISSTGMQPQPGYELNIPDKGYLYITFSLIGGLQLILVIVTTFMANRVIVTDDSPLAIARLLRQFVDRLGLSGTILTGAEISKALTIGGEKVIYTVKRGNSNEKENNQLCLIPGKRERAFPNGKYD